MSEETKNGDAGMYTAAFDIIETPVALLTPAGEVLDVNAAFESLLGDAGPAHAGRAFEEYIHADDRDRLQEVVSDGVDTGAAAVTVRFGTDTAPTGLYRLTVEPVDAGGGDPSLVVRIDRITERPESVLDRMTDAFFAVDENWRFTYVNEQARPILTAAMDADADTISFEGRHIWETIPDAVDTPFYDAHHEAMETQETTEVEAYYEPLETWFNVRTYPSESGVSVYFQDVTERRRTRERIESRERAIREIYDITADRDLSFEEKIGDLLAIGCDRLGTEYGTLSRIEGDEYVFEVVEAPTDAIQAGDTVPLSATNCERTATEEATLVLGDIERDAPALAGRAGNAEWDISCYVGAPVMVDDAVYGTLCFYDERPRSEGFSDWEVALVDLLSQWASYELTEKRARERLERTNQQLEQFASIVSHDLRAPLGVLDGSLELAEETGEPVHFDRARTAIGHMETLIEDLLELAKAGERITEREPVALAEAVATAWTMLEAPEGTLSVEVDRTVSADPGRLEQLLTNLFRNAIEHGGTPADADGSDAGVSITVGPLPDGFFVADDGPGIPADDREDVLEAGYTTAESGSGFGLSIVATVADAHGWDVTVTDSDAGGARFEITGIEDAADA